jgi:hypothetical protein
MKRYLEMMVDKGEFKDLLPDVKPPKKKGKKKKVTEEEEASF